MNYVLNWLLPQQVMYIKYGGKVGVEESQIHIDAILRALATVPPGQQVTLINDMSEVSELAVELPAMQRMARAITMHPHVESIVNVGMQDITTQMNLTILGRIGHLPLQFVETNHAAYQWVTNQFPAYKHLPPPVTWTEVVQHG